MTTFSHSSTTPSVSVTTASGNNQSQLVATPVPDEQRISFWPQHFGLIPQWVTLEPRVFGWMDRLCEDYCGGIWNLYTLNNGGAFIAPEPDEDDGETWILFNAMNGNRAEMSPEAAGIAACLMPVLNVCRIYPLSTGNQDKRHRMKSLTTETALDILIVWLQDNIDCESGIIFDNDEDKTDSAALLPCIEQAREGIRTLRQLQLLHQNR